MRRKRKRVPCDHRVRGLWEGFARAVLPPDAHPVQRQEMRRAFYGGCWAMLMTCSGIGDDSISEDDGVAILEEMRKELEAFQADVLAGRA